MGNVPHSKLGLFLVTWACFEWVMLPCKTWSFKTGSCAGRIEFLFKVRYVSHSFWKLHSKFARFLDRDLERDSTKEATMTFRIQIGMTVIFFHEWIFVSISRESHYKLSGKEKRSALQTSVAASCIKLVFTGCPSGPTHLGSFFNEWYSECVNARILSFCILGSVRQSREPMKMESSWIFRASLAK